MTADLDWQGTFLLPCIVMTAALDWQGTFLFTHS